jgi:hypothetical protein
MKGNIKLAVFLLLSAIVIITIGTFKFLYNLSLNWMGVFTLTILYFVLYSTKEDDHDYEEIIVEEEIEIDGDEIAHEGKEIIVEIDEKDKTRLNDALRNNVEKISINSMNEFGFQLIVGVLGCLSGFLISLGIDLLQVLFRNGNRDHVFIEITSCIFGFLLMYFAIKIQRRRSVSK